MDNILVPYILAIAVSSTYAILIVKILLLKYTSRKRILYIEKKKDIFILGRLLAIGISFLIYYLTYFHAAEMYINIVMITLFLLSSVYYILKYINSPRMITTSGIVNIKIKYGWTDIVKWEWKENNICIDLKKQYKLGSMTDYVEIDVDKENIDYIEGVFQHFKIKHK